MAVTIATAVASVAVMEEDDVPDTYKDVLTNALIGGREFIPDLIHEIPKMLPNRMESLRYYTEQNGGPVPNFQSYQYTRSPYATLDVFTSNDFYGANLYSQYFATGAYPTWDWETTREFVRAHDIGYVIYNEANWYAMAMFKLQQEHGYIPETNRITNLEAANGVTYLDKITLSIKTSSMGGAEEHQFNPFSLYYAEAGQTHTRTYDRGRSPEVDHKTYRTTGVDNVLATVTYNYKSGSSNLTGTLSLTLPSPAAEFASTYMYAHYLLKDSRTGRIRYIDRRLYKYHFTGLEPDITSLGGPGMIGNEYAWGEQAYPRIYFRLNKVSLSSANPHGNLYNIQKKAASKFYNMDFDNMVEEIEGNPDIDNLDMAMIQSSVPLMSTHPVDKQYLFAYMDKMSKVMQWERTFGWWLSGGMTSPPPRITSYDGVRIAGLLANSLTIEEAVLRTIGPVGTVAVNKLNSNGTNLEFVKQLTSSTCKVITLNTIQYYYETDLQRDAINDEDLYEIQLPVDRVTLYEVLNSKEEIEIFLYRSLHYTFTSSIRIVTKWYQEFFAGVLFVAAVMVSVISFGKSIGTLAAAISVGSIAAIKAIIINFVLKFLVALAVAYGFQIVADLIGGDLALILATIGLVVGIAFGGMSSGVKGAPWAQDLLSISSNLMQGINKNLSQEMKELQKEFEVLEERSAEFQEELDKAFDLLDTGSKVLKPFTIFGEGVDQFYERTVHSGNIGILSINAVSDYVSTNLALPSFTDSLGEQNNDLKWV